MSVEDRQVPEGMRRWCGGVQYAGSREPTPEELKQINLRLLRQRLAFSILASTALVLFAVALVFREPAVRLPAACCGGVFLLIGLYPAGLHAKLVRSGRTAKVDVYEGDMIQVEGAEPLQFRLASCHEIRPNNTLRLIVTSESGLALSVNGQVIGPWFPVWDQPIEVVEPQESAPNETRPMSDLEAVEYERRYALYVKNRRLAKILVAVIVVLVVAAWIVNLVMSPTLRMIPLADLLPMVILSLVVYHFAFSEVSPRLYKKDLKDRMLVWDSSGRSAVLAASGQKWVVDGRPAGWRLGPASSLPEAERRSELRKRGSPVAHG
jgi:hypothetical protein